MSSPISGSSPIIPNEFTAPSTFSETPFGSNLTNDTQSSFVGVSETPVTTNAQVVIEEPRITISEFSQAVLGQLAVSRQTLNQSVQTYIESVRSQGFLRIDLGNLVQGLALENFTKNLQLSNLRDTQNAQINSMNASTLLYNGLIGNTTLDSQQLSAMNNAITQYNAGNISEAQFNAAATAYNAYATVRNTVLASAVTTYNTAVNTFTSQVQQNNNLITNVINPQRLADGLTPIALQSELPTSATQLPIQALSPPVPAPQLTGGPAAFPLLSNIPATSPSTLLSILIKTLFSLINDPFALDNTYDVLAEGVEKASTNLNFQDPAVAVSFVERIPSSALATNISQSGGGAGVSIIVGVSSGLPSSGSIQNQITKSNLQNYIGELTLSGYQQLSAFEAQSASSIGLFSAIPGVRLIGATGLTSASSTTAFGIAFGVTQDQIVSQYIASGVVEEGVRAILLADIENGAQVADVDTAVEIISAEIKANLLQQSLYINSLVTSAPGLGSAVIASATGLTSSELDIQAQLTADEVLADSFKLAYIKTTLAQSLATSATIQSEQAQTIINQAVDNALAQGNIRDSEDLKQRLNESLIAQGIAASTAQSLAERAAEIVAAETNPQGFQSGNLFNQNQVVNSLSGQLSSLGYDVSSASALASQAASAFFANGIATNAVEYRLSLEAELIRQGLTAEGARQAATGVVALLNIAPSGLSPLQLNSSGGTLTISEIQAEYYNLLVEGLTPAVGSDTARSIADQGVNALLGSDQSILTQLNDIQRTRETYGLDTAHQIAVRDYRELQSPSIDLYTFSQRLMDPANALFMSAATGLTYSGVPIPSNYKRSLDIQV